MEENHYEYTGVLAENNIHSDFMDILYDYEHLYESNNNLTIEEENAMLPQTNQNKLPDIL